jgi:dTDP-4-dehydrorhamnose reductase
VKNVLGKVLVFGPNGQVGTHVLAFCESIGIETVAADRSSLDMRRPELIFDYVQLQNVQGVINCAAYTEVDKAEDDFATANAVNSLAPHAMGNACAQLGIPLVHFSTDYVFDGTSHTPYNEDSVTAPLGAYGATKLAGEAGVMQSGARAAVIRLAWVFSAHGKNFVKTMLRLSASHAAIRVVDDQIGAPTAACDAAIAGITILHALAIGENVEGIYHLGGDKVVSWAEFAVQIFKTAKLETQVMPIPSAEYPTPAKRPGYSVLDSGKISQTFGIRASNWQSRLAEVIDDLSNEK